MNRPPDRPTCPHGKELLSGCKECFAERELIRHAVRPLVDRFWLHRGKNAGDLEDLMMDAYRMGKRVGEAKVKEVNP